MFVSFYAFHAYCQNSIKLSLEPDKEVTKSIKAGELQEIPITLKISYNSNLEKLRINLINASDDTFWFSPSQMPYTEFKKKAKKTWESKAFKHQNQNIRAYMSGVSFSPKGSVFMLQPDKAFDIEIQGINSETSKNIKFLTFYTSVNESKGILFWKKNRKMDQQITVDFDITIPPVNPCLNVDLSGYEMFLQQQIDDLDILFSDVNLLKKSKKKDKQTEKTDYNNQLKSIERKVSNRNELCSNTNTERKIKDINRKCNEITVLLNSIKNPGGGGNGRKVTPPSLNCSDYNKLINAADKLYLDIRNARAKGGNLSGYSGQLSSLKQQANAIGGSCSQAKEFNRAYNAALNELNKK